MVTQPVALLWLQGGRIGDLKVVPAACRRPGAGQDRLLGELGDAGQREVARRYAAAWESGDVETIVAMLTEDARYSMPPLTVWYEGREQLRGFLTEVTGGRRWRFLPTSANGQLAFGTYLWNDAAAAYLPAGLDLLVLRGRRVAEVVSFLDVPLPDFDLPDRLPGRKSQTGLHL
ncbi:nuclear transport factor 2 family protein [Micromonospora aurantiaca]|nr:nuclear transport factor 2 family protein [Micromonospora aurantiaca]